MPTGPDGLPFFYPSKTNGFSYFQSADILDDSNFNGEGDVTNSANGLWTFNTSGPTSVQIFKNSDTADSIGGCNMNFEDTAERGYGYKADDPRDIELKFLIKFVDANSDNGFAIEGPTGRHSGSGCCQGFAYKLDIDFQTTPVQWRFRKEMWHVSNSNDPVTGVWTTSLAPTAFLGNGNFVGIGYCHYVKTGGANSGHNTPDSVILEAWFNPTPLTTPNNWTMIKRTEDKGGWGNDGGDCNGDPDQIGAWSNSNFRLKCNADGGEFQLQKLSLREIDPTKSFDEDQNTPPPGQETGDPTIVKGFFKLLRDINTYRTSACAGAGGGGGGGSAIFYTVSAVSEKELSDHSTFDNRTRLVAIASNSSSPLVGKTIKQVDVPLKKAGSPPSTPVVSSKIWSSTGVVRYTSPTTFDPSTFTTSYVKKTFDYSTNTYVMVSGDRVGIEYTHNSSSNYILGGYDGSDPVPNTVHAGYELGVWDSSPSSRDFACDLWQ